MTTEETRAVTWAWAQQSVWSQVATDLRKRVQRTRWAALGLTVAVAALALAASQLTPTHRTSGVVVSVVAAAVAALLALAQAAQAAAPSTAWTRARSVSEAVKSEVYLFLSATDRYAGPDRAQVLDRTVQRLAADVADLVDRAVGVVAVTRPLPAVNGVEEYVQVRVRTSQVGGYYGPLAGRNRTRARQASLACGALALLAAVLSALAAVSASLAAWSAVATTAVAAVAANAAAERYRYLVLDYGRTATELDRLVTRRTTSGGLPLPDDQLPAACEAVISIENSAWMAKLAAPPPLPAGG